MDRIRLPERPDWRDKAKEVGFTFADMYGEAYWDETSAYSFTLDEVETRIEDPCTELHGMCLAAVDAVIADEALLDRLQIPVNHRDLVAQSWRVGEGALYGRMDLAYDGQGPARLMEYNADTPTSLYESAGFQWMWLEDQIAARVLPEGADQFNRLHEALVERFAEMFAPGTEIHFTAISDAPEDYATVESLAWAAREAGMGAHYTDLQNIGVSDQGQFADDEDRVIGTLFKLYPWEDMFRDSFAPHLAPSGCRFVEPPWKAILSNKGILPVLWQMFPGHPNLLPAFFADDAAGLSAAADLFSEGHVAKPLFSREGASVDILAGPPGGNGAAIERAAARGYDDHPKIVQAYHPLPVFAGQRPVIGAWIVGDTCVGMGLREDAARITQDMSRFKPHFIEG